MEAAEPAEEPPTVDKGTKGMAVLSDDEQWHFCVVTKVRGEGTGLEVLFTDALGLGKKQAVRVLCQC
jgi:hypothetical protein